MNAARTLFTSIVDYAGLFPPAELLMRPALARYAGHRTGPYAWMVGRFVLPLAQLDEFEHAFDALPAEHRAVPWALAVLGGKSLDADARRIVDFNRRHGDEGRQDARIEAIDLKVHSLEDIERAADVLSEPGEIYFEIAISADPGDRIAAVAAAGGRAKVRTGGVREDMFPSVPDLARFLSVCAANHVPFKATAGLHHAIRSAHPITSDPDAPVVTMHGFVNLFVAAALAAEDRVGLDGLEQVLGEQDAAAFHFDQAGVSTHGRRLNCEELTRARRQFALSYGSCSIEEPTAELTALGLI
ncbi:MAG: hypothetical protein ACM3NQ_17430 [Bacteroidales bacterium]